MLCIHWSASLAESCLHLQAGATGNEAAQAKAELEQMEEDRAAHSNEFPIFQLIPKEMMINRGKNLKLLPNELGQWHTKVGHSLPSKLCIMLSLKACL